LIVHLLLGFRRLRDIDYYADDPIVKRVVGVDISYYLDSERPAA
jgi:hypothetical protein